MASKLGDWFRPPFSVGKSTDGTVVAMDSIGQIVSTSFMSRDAKKAIANALNAQIAAEKGEHD